MSARHPRHRVSTRWSLSLLCLVLLALAGNALAGSLNLAWDGVVGASGYRLAYGTASATYTANLDAGNATSAAVTGLTDGTRYYFAVQAYNATATSGFSNEVSAVVPTTAPVASFTASRLNVRDGQSITFVDTSTGTVTSRSWNLGDGSTAISPSVVHTYRLDDPSSTAEAKTVTLSVDGAGVTSTASRTINVTAAPPVASFTGTPVSGTAPLAVTFSDGSTGSITGWSWSFGNGTTSTLRNPTATYSGAGTYSVSLTVTGPGGSHTATRSGYVTVTAAPPGDGTVSTVGLVGAYGFDEASGTQVLDASGRGNHGTLANGTRSTAGRFGRAIAFNGTSSLVTVPDSAALDLTNALTLTAWVYPTSWASGWKSLIMKERTGGLVYSLYANSNTDQPASSLRIASTRQSLRAGAHLPTNSWTHLATTYNGATQRFFVNGVLVDSRAQTGDLEVSAGPLRIGGNTVLANEYFQGRIDEVRVYRRALTPTEIAAVAQEPVSTNGLVAAYGFDEASGTQVLDASGRGNHGTLSNATRTAQAKFGRALSFNGSNSLVTVADSASLDLTSAMTLSAWVYPAAYVNGWKSLILKETSGGLVYSLYANSDVLTPNTTLTIGGAERILSAGNRLVPNTWTHLAATYNGAMQRLYVNGAQVGSRAQTGGIAVSGGALRIGGNLVWSSEYFQGLIDEVRLYQRLLTPAEITAVAQEPVAK